jgi:lipoprotein-anchoring transpeptidase ErfK/SrfK
MKYWYLLLSLIAFSGFHASASDADPSIPTPSILISIRDQKLALFQNGARVAEYPISTSRYGIGDSFGSYATPVGTMEVAQKIGEGWPLGTVFHDRRPTGEILRPNAPGRDPIVTRILWLRGLESSTRNAYARGIYIHGTPVERNIGRPASYGCIRMRSRDVAELFEHVGVGTPVNITQSSLSQAVAGM